MAGKARMSELLTNGGIFGFILGLMLLEAAVLIVYFRRTGAGIAPLDLLINFLSGIGLLLAIVAVLAKAPPLYIALFLATSLLSHVTDLSRRWRRAP
jgi:hypothetical protein